MNDLARQWLQYRPGPLDGVVVATDHEGQGARGGPLDATGDGRVELSEAQLLRPRVDGPGVLDGDRRRVDEQCPRLGGG